MKSNLNGQFQFRRSNKTLLSYESDNYLYLDIALFSII